MPVDGFRGLCEHLEKRLLHAGIEVGPAKEGQTGCEFRRLAAITILDDDNNVVARQPLLAGDLEHAALNLLAA